MRKQYKNDHTKVLKNKYNIQEENLIERRGVIISKIYKASRKNVIETIKEKLENNVKSTNKT
jgi:hypothetical protein